MPNDHIITRGEPYRELVILTSGRARSEPADLESLNPSGNLGSLQLRDTSNFNGCVVLDHMLTIWRADVIHAREPISQRQTQKELDLCVEFPEGSFFGELVCLPFVDPV